MSILIKGIDMPNSGQIELIIRPHGKVFSKTRGISAEAIQIPTPHGRLIDGEELLKEYKQWLESVPYINNTMSEMGQRIVLIDICHDLEYSAPTILEAEEQHD